MLAVHQLCKTYRTGTSAQVVFDNLDLSVSQGESVALLGASGSGKTTLLNLLSGIDAPDAGSIQVRGQRVHELAEPSRTLFRRQHIGFVFQFFNLIPTLTIEENLLLPLELNHVEHPDADRRVSSLLDAVGLTAAAQRFPDTLSGGEQQRVAVARALIHRPALLLADEPTGNLDDATGRSVTDLLLGMAREHGTTMLIVTHSDTVAEAADRVLRLHQGRLVPQ